MMEDIVLDTCTLVHANSSGSKYQKHSIKLIEKLISNAIFVTVDEGFDLNETENKSYIALEYLKHLSPGMLGHSLIQYLALNGRFSFVSNVVNNSDKKYIEKIIRNKKDRIFLRVTLNSNDKILVSHDYEDYQKIKRKKIKKDLNIKILEAEDMI